MPRHWTAEERETLGNLVADGVKIIDIQKKITRTIGAISLRANKLDYGTESIKGDKTLYSGVHRRNRRKQTGETQTTANSLEPVASESLDNNSDVSLANPILTPLEVNTKVVEIFSSNNIEFDPDIACLLSKHIINTQGGAS